MTKRPTHILDTLRTLPDSAQRPDAIDVESETVNLPAVRPDAAVAVPARSEHLLEQVLNLADAFSTRPRWKGRYRWASALPEAIREGDPATFRALIVAGLAHGFDGQVVTAGEFEVALLEVDAQLTGVTA